uniref:Uncharacterized protein n=1 Tax=Avena sativa TaxID=4498 RepID=A0ACD5YT37_AVESA
MKIVLWRMAHNCLPTGDQLHLRSIPTSIRLKLKNFSNMRLWLLDWVSEASDYHMVVFAVAIWHIWENRNNIRNGEAVPHPGRVLGKIKAYIDFILMNDFSSTTSTRRVNQRSIQKWSPPPGGLLLMNVDAAIFSNSGRMGYGVIIRDHSGFVYAASRGYVNHVVNPELAEAMAVRHALNFAAQAGFQNLMVVSDCLSLINKVKSMNQDRSHTGAVVYDIKCKALKFVTCNFGHVDRSSNEAAHVLAKSAEHDVGSCWFSEIPDVIRTIVCNERCLSE